MRVSDRSLPEIRKGASGYPSIESFNGRLRDELLNETLFTSTMSVKRWPAR
jgi:hypothetical protein